jgi:hypothetical protein
LKIKRVYHHFTNMEEYQGNMWKQIPVEQRRDMIIKSRDLMLDIPAFKAAMFKAVDIWPNSSAANLSASVINHQAWLGHAGCAVNHDAPEDLTRLAWAMLTKDQQDLANIAADEAKAYWIEQYAKN